MRVGTARRPTGLARTRIAAAVAVTLAGLGLGGLTIGDASTAAVHTGRDAPRDANGRLPVSNTTIPPSKITVALTPLTTVEQPLAVVQRRGDETIYVVSKLGTIRALRNATLDPTPVLDLSARIDTTNERGLLGLAFPPSRTDVLYVDYTTKNGNVVVSEMPFDGRVADVTKERVLLDMAKPFNEHNAGTIVFDGAGMLLVGIGDGGGSGDKFNNGQRTDVLLGKVLRIDPTADGTKPYRVPSDNPFVKAAASLGVGGGRPRRTEILAYGLRNPWRISVDPVTGDVWIPDVGQNKVEEVNRLTQSQWGANFGWKLREGNIAFSGQRPAGALDPVYAYPHLDGRCAIVGGFVYRGMQIPGLVGTYVFGDVCSGKIAALRSVGGQWVPEDLHATLPYLTAFGQLTNGELVATSLEGSVVRLGAG